MEQLSTILTPKVRQYIYGIVVAAIPLLLIAGLIAPEQAALWLNLGAAVLGLGTTTTAAAAITSQRKNNILP